VARGSKLTGSAARACRSASVPSSIFYKILPIFVIFTYSIGCVYSSLLMAGRINEAFQPAQHWWFATETLDGRVGGLLV
jgi:hypothetical protein